MPFLAAPSPNGEALLEDAMRTATTMGLVKPNDYVVVVQRVHEDFCIKIVEVSDTSGIKRNANSMSGISGENF